MTAPSPIDRRRAITATLIAIAAAAVVFAALVWHRRWISDDGLIVVRTVRQLLAGNGPVYNALERTEPNTSTLWTYVLALAGLVTRASVAHLAVALGGLAAIGGLVLAMDGARRWHRARGVSGLLVPAGALIVLGASPFWDFATSGLETGLGQLWLGLSWWLLVTLRAGAAPRRHAITAVVIGLGPLVRPDFAIATAVFAPAAWWILRPRPRRAAQLALAMIALPVGYEVFRAGYYGALVPLPALAKSASAAMWARGVGYAMNFSHGYALWLPLAALLAIGAMAALRSGPGSGSGDRDAARAPELAGRRPADHDRVIALAPIAAGVAMAIFVVRVGGDFMHARMLLPAAFTAVLPAMVLPVTRRFAPALAVLAGWALVVGIRRDQRIYGEGVMDEWAGYRGWTHSRHPIDPALFVAADRPGSDNVAAAIRAGRRRLLTEAVDVDAPMNPALAGPVVYAAGRLGTGGAVVPLDGIAADTLGLASPLGARITVTSPGMPGHEKMLPRAWLLAQFADPAYDSIALPDAPPRLVASARRAMTCGALAELLASTRAPLTARRFWDNLTGAIARTRLVIPADPLAAEAALCGGPLAVRASSSYNLDGWSPVNAIDGLRTTVPRGSQGYSSALDPGDRPEWIAVAVPAGRVSKVVLYPTANPTFPLDFQIQIWNGAAWVDRVVRTDYPLPDGAQTFLWSPADATDQVRIYATRLRLAGPYRALQLAEIETAP